MIPNVWGGSFEVSYKDSSDPRRSNADDDSKTSQNDYDRASLLHQQQHVYGHDQLDEIHQSWLLAPADAQTRKKRKKKEYVDLGCIICKRKVFKWIVWGTVVAILVIVLPTILATSLPKHKPKPPPPDNYTVALHKALMFFNAQKSGKLPKHNNISWRGNSGLHDGSDLTDVKGGLVGGYYDAGDNVKFNFPMSFAMTMLSWSVIEYPHKYRAIGEYDHARELIKWGTDYLLKTFNSTADKIDKIYSQVGGANNNSNAEPNDHSCWMRPEDMDYPRPVQTSVAGPELGGEMAAALAAASIVFQDNPSYSAKLVKGAKTCFRFARDSGKRTPYSRGNPFISPYYNSSGYFDEYMWGGMWVYLATGNDSYGLLATNPGIPRNAKAFRMNPDTSVLSWDNKLPAAMLLLTRFRMFLNPGYPYEATLNQYQNVTGLNMCSYMKQFGVFNWTKGGLIELNHGQPQNLQYVANTAFLANLFVDYLNATGVPGWYCGSHFFKADVLRDFATSQIDYILGKNPAHMSYVVGFSDRYPKHVHHRAASIPRNNIKYSCKGGFKWLDSKKANPNTITGAMVGGPDKHDRFKDSRKSYGYTEPTMAGNAGLVAALVSLTSSGGYGIDRNLIFSGVPPLYPQSPPPPPPWKPN